MRQVVGEQLSARPTTPRIQDLLAKKVLKECVHCGLCLDFCPPYRLLGHEADSPRGRIYQIRQVYEGKISADDPDFREHISCCLDCRACQTACPSGVQYGAIIEAARAIAEPISPSEKTVGRAILGTVFTRKPLLDAAGLGLRLYQRSGLQGFLRKSGALRVLPPRLREMEAMLAPAQGGIRRWAAPQVSPARGPVRYRVGFIEGCIMPQLFGDTNAATVRVLAANGCVVFSPPKQGCCGALQMHTGDRETARDLARRNVDAFDGLGLDAGISNLTHPDISVELLEQKMDHVLATGATGIVAPNPGCTMQLAFGARRRGVDLQLYHVVDLLDMAYRSASPSGRGRAQRG